MKKIATLTAAALVVAACGPAGDPAQKYRDAMPKDQQVAVGTPSATTAAGALTVRPNGNYTIDLSGTKSEFAVMSYFLAVMINGGTKAVLGLVRWVTLHHPTSCDDSSCTWGPFVDDKGLNYVKLVVTKNGDQYDYAFQGQRGDLSPDTWETVISGTAIPGGDPDHGSGNLTLDFDAEARLMHGGLWQRHDFGHVTIAYDNTVSPVTVTAEFIGGHNEKSEVVNAAYQFLADSSGGDLQVAFENVTTPAVVTLHTRWKPTGAGRGDAHAAGFDVLGNPVTYDVSECWDGEVNQWAEVYDSRTSLPADESLCSPYVTAVPATLQPPATP